MEKSDNCPRSNYSDLSSEYIRSKKKKNSADSITGLFNIETPLENLLCFT